MLYLKAFHIIGVVVWFSGLFYLGRLFVYHQEAGTRPEHEAGILKAQFALMEKRLWYAITWPGLVVSIGLGLALIPFVGFPGWLHVKLTLVVILLGYHFMCGYLRKQLLADQCRWSSKQFRMFNEIPSLLLISIVCVVVLKDAFSWINVVVILLVVGGLIGGTIHYLSKRKHPSSATK